MAETLACPECDEVFPRRRGAVAPESWRGVRQRVVKHCRKKHNYPSPEVLRAVADANARVEALGDPLSATNLVRRLQGERKKNG